MDPLQRFNEIGMCFKEAQKGSLFGKPCFKINGKAFVCFFQESMVFKLNSPFLEKAIGVENAQLFDPSGKGRPMKERVQIPFEHENLWEDFAHVALEYVSGKV